MKIVFCALLFVNFQTINSAEISKKMIHEFMKEYGYSIINLHAIPVPNTTCDPLKVYKDGLNMVCSFKYKTVFELGKLTLFFTNQKKYEKCKNHQDCPLFSVCSLVSNNTRKCVDDPTLVPKHRLNNIWIPIHIFSLISFYVFSFLAVRFWNLKGTDPEEDNLKYLK